MRTHDKQVTSKSKHGNVELTGSKQDKDGTVRQDRHTQSSEGSQHDWSRSDPVTGQHQEGSAGPNRPKK